MRKAYLLVILLILCQSKIFSHEINFEHIGTEEGLSQISVLSIYQDKLGYMWFGTREGLNRYDGQNIKVFYSKEDEPGLSSNIINTIYGHEEQLFIHCGYHQLVSYDIRKDQFSVVDNNCQHIGQGKERLWFSSKNELRYFSYADREIKSYYTLQQIREIHCVFEASNKKLYVGTESGLVVLDENKMYTRLLDACVVSCVYEDSKQNIWVGTSGKGVYKINRNGMTEHYSASDGRAGYALSNDIIRDFCEDNFGQVWIATFYGLNRMIPETGQVFVYQNAGNNPTGLAHNSIYSLYKDRQGTVWIGTYYGGVNYHNPEYNIYKYYYPGQSDGKTVNFPIVGKIVEDREQNLWICTEGGGLQFFDRRGNRFHYYRAGDGSGLSHDNLKCIWYNEQNNKLYIGTYMGGLTVMDIDKQTFKHFSSETSERLPGDIVETIYPYKDRLVIFTQKGIVCLNLQTETIEPFFRDPRIEEQIGIDNIAGLYIDTKDNLWLPLTEGGVYRYDLKSGESKVYTRQQGNEHTIGRHLINCIYETKKGQLLFASLGSGLFEYIPEKDHFVRYSAAEKGFLSDFINYVTETNNGYLFLLTNAGINLLDQDRQSHYSISKENGFPLEKINPECGVCITKNGEIFVGGTNGMVSFFENQINRTAKDYSLFFSDLYVDHTAQQVAADTEILKEALPYLKEIRLRHDQTNIRLEFASSNYIRQTKVPLEYQLTGFDHDWIPLKEQYIRYSNLRPGQYTLVVREALSGTSGRERKQISLGISVVPPFYASPLAFVIYFLLVVLIVWSIIHLNKIKLKLKTSLEFEIRENNRIQELNQTKLQFFTNISHEFRTPLTLILGQIESILQMDSISLPIQKRMGKIHKNASHLLALISELLDFRKQERDMLELKVSEMNVVEFAQKVFYSFKDLAERRQVDYTFYASENKILLWFDPVQMQKVLYNLLSNAFKYSEEHSTITVSVEKKHGNEVLISVSDSGIGISEEDLPKIFDRFYQGRNVDPQHNPGTGIGLALAKGIIDLHHGTIGVRNNPDRGSTFVVSLPTGSDHFTSEEKTNASDADWNFFREEGVPEQLFFEEIKRSHLTEHASSSESTILIVEDNEDLLHFLDEIFSPIYHVETAKDGFEALEKVKNIQPDIVLSDIMMPKMSGKELCVKLKSNFDTSHIPVVLITADMSEEQNLEGLMAGADDYITKPFNVKALISRCNNLVLSQKRLKERYSREVGDSPVLIATNKRDQELINRATEVVLRYIDDPEFNVNQFAVEMALGRSKLYLKIKGITGMTPNEFILNIRLKKAASLLVTEPELNISDITYRLGFNTPRYFSKCFKDLFGISPLNYRKLNGDIDGAEEPADPEDT